MELENMNLSGNKTNDSEPGTAQTQAYPQVPSSSSRPLERSSWGMFLKRERLEGFSLACSPRTSSYSGALTNVLFSVDDSKDACFFSQNSQVNDAKQENDSRAFKRRSAREEDRSTMAHPVAIPAAAIKPRRRAFASKLGFVGTLPSNLHPSGRSEDLDAKVDQEEEFRICSILRSGREERTHDEIDDDRADQFFKLPGSALKQKPRSPKIQGDSNSWDVEGGFDGDDEDEGGCAMDGFMLQLTEADFQTPGVPSEDKCTWRQSRLHHHRSTSRWLPRRFHEAGLGDPEEESDGPLVPPEQLTTIEEFSQAMNQAAAKGDRGRADSLWREMWHSKNIPPNLQLLNAYTRALAKSLAHPDDAENIAREVCIAGSLSPNATTYTLLTEARLRYEQIFSEI